MTMLGMLKCCINVFADVVRESDCFVPHADSDIGALTTSVETNRMARVVDLQFAAIARFHQVVQALKH